MESKVSGSQPMSISWYKDDKEITSGQKYQLEMKETTATLGITQIEKCDEGVYTCRATNSAGFKESSGTLCWLKNETEITSNDKCRLSFTDSVASLDIVNCSVDDSGDYVCVASSDAGSDHCSSTVTVKEISMQCTLKGSLPMTVSWIKEDHEVKEGEHIQISYETRTAVLTLRNTQMKHGGKYICQAQNEAGSQKCLATLTVKGWLDI
uniref:Ig-like domain-containing protein n=1 Tax=Oncorhynchus kisutch TaxID=8019 RepID=A0A8C7GM97_ONCKI